MVSDTPGLHHVTGLVEDGQAAIDFYTRVLGLRLAVQTVNFEDMLQHHLYFSAGRAEPGTVFTCFPDPYGDPGRVGAPQVESVAFAVPEGSLASWDDRLECDDVDADEPTERLDETVIRLRDPSGTRIELVGGAATRSRDAPPETNSHATAVPDEVSIRTLHGVSTLSVSPYGTAEMLETLGFDYVTETDGRIRYRAPGPRATVVDVLDREITFGREGAGTIHHVAVRAASEAELHEWRELFASREYDVSRVKDRHFFHSLYVRGPGGVLFELATEPDGFDVDPTSLYLPDRFEPDRELIESQLPELTAPDVEGSTSDRDRSERE